MTKSAIGTVTLANDILVENNLTISRGTLADEGYTIEVHGDVINRALHTSKKDNPARVSPEGIKMSGTSVQSLLGQLATTSKFGILTIDNPTGVTVPVNGYTFSITDRLQLSRGILHIGSTLLILDVFASISEVNPFGDNNMISTNGSFTDNGIMKKFPIGWVSDLTFPVGGTFYNPVSFSFGNSADGHTSGTTPGSLRVKVSSQAHPSVSAVASPPVPTHRDNVLQHYWILDGETLTDFRATATFTYSQVRVKVDDPAYSEADYIDARFLTDNNSAFQINKGIGVVDDVANTIAINLFNVTDAGISGDYFAGIDEALATNVALYTTTQSGNVRDAIYTPPVPGGGAPKGALVIVDTGHTLTLDVNSISFYATEIRGTLEVQGTYSHRLGDLTGTGTLALLSDINSIVLPSAYYSDFFSSTGGSLIYGGTGSYSVLGGITELRNLSLFGSGLKTMANNATIVYNDLNISGGTFNQAANQNLTIGNNLHITGGGIYNHGLTGTLDVGNDLTITSGSWNGGSAALKIIRGDVLVNGGTFNAGSGGEIDIKGNLTFSSGTFGSGSNTSKIVLNGSSLQSISGNFTTANSAGFHNLAINNAAGIQLNGNVDISKQLTLTNGIIEPAGHKLFIPIGGTVLPVGGLATSFVNGRFHKELLPGESFTFPIGRVDRWRPASVVTVAGGTYKWEAEYFPSDPTAPPYNDTSSDPFIVAVSAGEYWKISDGATGGSAKVGLSWGIESDVSSQASERETLQVVKWNPTNTTWDNYGGTNFSSGHTQAGGSFVSTSPASFSEQIFTLGSHNLANPLPIELVYFTARKSASGVVLTWQTASEWNNDYFEIEASPDGERFNRVAIIKGRGNSSQTANYEFVDKVIFQGLYYYRLKQVDFDGKVQHSRVVRVLNDDPPTLYFDLYPQPASHEVNFQFSPVDAISPLSFTIYDMKGAVVKSATIDPTTRELMLDVSLLPSGLYIVRLNQLYFSYQEKFIIQK